MSSILSFSILFWSWFAEGFGSTEVCSNSKYVQEHHIAQRKVVNGLSFPLVLSPRDSNATLSDRLLYLSEERDELLDLAKQHGAVILRGWGPAEAEHFSKVREMLEDEPHFDMSCSAGPRTEVAKGVFTANEAPPEDTIPFHHEMAQCDAPPKIVMFYCKTPPPKGGETSLMLSQKVTEFLREKHPEAAEKLGRLGVRYVRRQAPDTDSSSALGKGWKINFQTDTKQGAEEQMRIAGTTWEWLEKDYLHTITRVMPAMPVEEHSSQEVFFTAAETTLKEKDIEPQQELRPMKGIIFGDGSPLDDATRSAFRDVGRHMEEAKVSVPWQEGDVLIIYNARTMHAREMFTPPREIYASMFGRLEKEPLLRPRQNTKPS
eukprot:TRINITY_DN18769_c2_g3_i1.p1 TRINITY_DN18769_c2_g3~~TRINITY_DN18769_c2_g3_i1.p1  ORF type:complete len:375 (-),score=66.81 TRINITY_DN18769_c2_g3_i1:322-1446(-)